MSPRPVIRPMMAVDLPFAHRLSRDTGWNQTAADWARFLSMEPEGCFVAMLDDKIAGTVTTTAYGSAVGWIGMLLVLPELQGRGIGKTLLQQAIESLQQRSVACIKLDATPAGQPLYERIGFQPEWTFQRWQMDSIRPMAQAKSKVIRECFLEEAHLLQSLDMPAFGASRLELLQALLAHGARGVACLDPHGLIQGFGFIRDGERAQYLGPVVATDSSIATSIVRALLEPIRRSPVFWDIPDDQSQSLTLARNLGFVSQRPLTRMFLGSQNVPGDPAMVHALSAPETG